MADINTRQYRGTTLVYEYDFESQSGKIMSASGDVLVEVFLPYSNAIFNSLTYTEDTIEVEETLQEWYDSNADADMS